MDDTPYGFSNEPQPPYEGHAPSPEVPAYDHAFDAVVFYRWLEKLTRRNR